MVFYLGRSVSEIDRELTQDEQIFFTDMASAHYKGCCYLCGDKRTLDFLCGNIGGAAQEIYRRLSDNLPQHGTVMDAVSTAFVLTMLDDGASETLPENLQGKDKRFLKVSDALAFDWKLNIPCRLVTEGNEDRVFYKYIANYWMNKQLESFRNVSQCSLNYTAGGGDTTGVGVATEAEQGYPVLCIIDTDWKYGEVSGHPPENGKTWQKAEDKEAELSNGNYPPFSLFPLHVHEAENLIPLCVLNALETHIPVDNGQQANYSSGLAMLARLKNLQTVSDPRLTGYVAGAAALYYDFKEGVQYILDNEPPDRRIYWESIRNELGESAPIPNQKTRGAPNTVFPHLHRKVLGYAIENCFEPGNSEYDRNRALSSPPALESPLNMMWDEIGLLLFTWGCAAVKKAADRLEQESAANVATHF